MLEAGSWAPAPAPPGESSGKQAGVCILDTGKACKGEGQGSIVDHFYQCAGKGAVQEITSDPSERTEQSPESVAFRAAKCSADTQGLPTGTCMCQPGYCADVDMECHKEAYRLLDDTFTMTTATAAAGELIYMAPDGVVKLGVPTDPATANWRISVTTHGAKLLWSESYPDHLLQEFQHCVDHNSALTGLRYQKCDMVVGHMKGVQADEMGWYVELHFQDEGASYSDGTDHYQLRAMHTWSVFHIDPDTKEGRTCQDRRTGCPGALGSLKFSPTLSDRVDFEIDVLSGYLPVGFKYYMVLFFATLFLLLLLCLSYGWPLNSEGSSKISRHVM